MTVAIKRSAIVLFVLAACGSDDEPVADGESTGPPIETYFRPAASDTAMTFPPVRVPVLTPPSPITSISSGWWHTCTLHMDGKARCWGNNASGQLGDGSREHRFHPVEVAEVDDVRSLVGGAYHTCAIVGDAAEVWCWGANDFGQAGLEDDLGSTAPHVVAGLSGVSMLAASLSHTCAIAAPGDVWCWGENVDGSLGDGTTMPHPTPTQVPSIDDATHIATGPYGTCVVRSTGRLACWGLLPGWNANFASLTPFEPTAPDPAHPNFTNAVEVVVASGNVITGAICIRTTGDAVQCAPDTDRITVIAELEATGSNIGARDHAGAVSFGLVGEVPFELNRLLATEPAALVSVGGSFVCAALRSGDVQCVGHEGDDGSNTFGQLGYDQGLIQNRLMYRRVEWE